MNTPPSRAPLVTTSAEEAANMMMSEGGPVRSAVPESPKVSTHSSWSEIQVTVERHPLTTLAVAFSVGFLAGICTKFD
ncbi:hypothetical protein DES53_101742 [Roseimicrobium gellanilyticum]|uniref:Uncharacterized protein n=1 Tax=Roseimicrobium gellanilyticum TaxID=748857 RepID=A0A366HUI8_9BACT|nr:hypothetical protein [Roseimicrobium gellanilyticum]RBP47942.1 hypothetical protein DES53_101742 [Roseimicrobium gellanilyticum]